MKFLSCIALLVAFGVSTSNGFQSTHQSVSKGLKSSSSKIQKLPTATSTPTFQRQQASALYAATQESPRNELDVDALVKYGSSIGIQMVIITALLAGLDALVSTIGIEVPFPAVFALFYFFSLKSRTFNPLNNQRPNLKKAVNGENSPSKGFRDRVMPSWTPPGVIFPIMWILVIGPLRSFSSALVYMAKGHHFCDPALLALLLHLSIGDVWNTINNTEKRYGAAVPSVLMVAAAAANAAYQYGQVDPLAGKLLGVTLVWFAVASTLIADTWRLNPDPVTGQRDPLYPVTGGASKTEFAWFNSNPPE